MSDLGPAPVIGAEIRQLAKGRIKATASNGLEEFVSLGLSQLHSGTA